MYSCHESIIPPKTHRASRSDTCPRLSQTLKILDAIETILSGGFPCFLSNSLAGGKGGVRIKYYILTGKRLSNKRYFATFKSPQRFQISILKSHQLIIIENIKYSTNKYFSYY